MEDWALIRRLAAEGVPKARIAARLGVSRTMGLFPQGGKPPVQQPLAGSGTTWSGTLDISSLPPGGHRLEVRAGDDTGATYEDTVQFRVPARTVKRVWSTRIPGRIQGALARHDELVVAATTEGVVRAFTPTTEGPGQRWERRVGSVLRGGTVSPDGSLVLIPSADHHVHAFDASSGAARWSRDLLAPLASEVVSENVHGVPRAFAVAGSRLVGLDLDGTEAWSTSLGGTYAGRPACDGTRVYTGCSDGTVVAVDASTGAPLWATAVGPWTDSYHRRILGCFDGGVTLLPDRALAITTFSQAMSLDRETGAVRWQSEAILTRGNDTPPTLTAHGVLVFAANKGTMSLLDLATGSVQWQDDTLPMTFRTRPLPTADPSVWWMVGTPGALLRIDLADRSVRRVLQVSTSFTYSTPVLARGGDLLIVGGQDGRLHGVTGLATA